MHHHAYVIAVVVIGLAGLASAGIACLIDSARRSSRAARINRRTH